MKRNTYTLILGTHLKRKFEDIKNALRFLFLQRNGSNLV